VLVLPSSGKKFTQEQRDKAVDDYLSGEQSAHQVAIELGADVQSIYRWKTLREEKTSLFAGILATRRV
jgi:transposase-like protein